MRGYAVAERHFFKSCGLLQKIAIADMGICSCIMKKLRMRGVLPSSCIEKKNFCTFSPLLQSSCQHSCPQYSCKYSCPRAAASTAAQSSCQHAAGLVCDELNVWPTVVPDWNANTKYISPQLHETVAQPTEHHPVIQVIKSQPENIGTPLRDIFKSCQKLRRNMSEGDYTSPSDTLQEIFQRAVNPIT